LIPSPVKDRSQGDVSRGDVSRQGLSQEGVPRRTYVTYKGDLFIDLFFHYDDNDDIEASLLKLRITQPSLKERGLFIM